MSKIPAGVKMERLDFIRMSQIPAEHQELLRRFYNLFDHDHAYIDNGVKGRGDICISVEIVEDYYSKFRPFTSTLGKIE